MAGTERPLLAAEAVAAVPAPVVILVKPQLGENIGTTARAMLNCGLSELRLVRPRDGWPSPKALNAASGADSVIAGALVFDEVAAAVADLHRVYAATARPRELVKPVIGPRAAASALLSGARAGQRLGLLFGPERTGLDNDALGHADTIIEIPLNPGFASLNLAQAVLLIAYEWRIALLGEPEGRLPLGHTKPAEKAEIEAFFRLLEEALEVRRFFPNEEMKPKMVNNMRAMFERLMPTQQEIQTLFGIVKTLMGEGRAARRREKV